MEPISEYLVTLHIGPRSTSRRRQQLILAARFLGRDPGAVTGEDLQAFIAAHPDWSLETQRSYSASLRGFFGWAHRNGRAPGNPAAVLARMRRPLPGPEWERLLGAYLTWLSTAVHRAPTTVKLHREHLHYFAHGCGAASPVDLDEDALLAWVGAEAQAHWKTETRRGYYKTLRSFYGWAVKRGHMATNPAADLPVIKQERPKPHPTPENVWARAQLAAGPRALLMLRLAAQVGLRRGEISRVSVEDLHTGADGGHSLLVHGKGNKERVVPVSDELAKLIAKGAAGHTRGAPRSGYLFPSGYAGRDHVSPEYVAELCKAAMPDGWTLHSLRHRFATTVYRGCKDLRVVQELLGHSSPAVTQIYVDVDASAKRAAMLHAV